jgi:integrase
VLLLRASPSRLAIKALAKTDASARHVNLNADALKAASRLLMRYERLTRRAGIKSDPGHYLLPKHLSRIAHGEHKGERGYDPAQHQQYWDTAWRSLTKAAGFDGLRFHDLRHSFITAMVERGVPIGVIQSQVGHMSARMVMHYTHVASGVGQRAVDLLNEEPMLLEIGEAISEMPAAGLPN